MHIFTIGILTIFLHSITEGGIQQSKSWADFESMMRRGGSYCLMLVCDYNKDEDVKKLEVYCDYYKTVKCYYGLEGDRDRGQPQTSFDKHFLNKGAPAFFFFKNGKQVTVLQHDSTKSPYSVQDVAAAFKSVQ
ncbi:uncharacterized protein LOC120353101 [Nilaparvata lugens]|uniref:uncharacterized protein LOC120353101 n=1 Tax=Nilaparvata lugens TaxID=108931 RepID=UPI00193D97AE|nr:uncharacterized protein LOC120353101 [Nilaparvata lugens]